jgi:hypothetical protein
MGCGILLLLGPGVPEFRNLADLFARLGVLIGSGLSADAALSVVTSAGVVAIDGAEALAVTIKRNGTFQTVAATSDLPSRVDAIQYELGGGPCVDAVVQETVFRSRDLRTETRWPQFACRAVAATGVLSMMSFRMFFEEETLHAGLNVYAIKPDAFDDLAETTALVLTTHAALALSSARKRERIENLHYALSTNRDIGTAIGILMNRHLATQQQAFDMLRVASQRTHRKLADIAHEVIDTGQLDYPGPTTGLTTDRPGAGHAKPLTSASNLRFS